VSLPELSAEQALAAATRRQSLAAPGSSIEEIADALVGLHNTTPVGPALSLRPRLRGFVRSDLAECMWSDWALVRFRAMRLTMFVFSTDLLVMAAAATRHMSEGLAQRWLRDSAFTPAAFDRVAGSVDEALTDGPLTVRALREALDVPKELDLPGVVSRMCDVGRLVGGAQPRSWRSAVRQYHRWVDVLPQVDLHTWDEGKALAELIRHYVGSYGPVTINDIAWWTGITKTRCRDAMATLDAIVEEVDVAGWPGPLYRIAGREIDDELGSAVHALPVLDSYVQGYRDRVRFLEPDRHDFVYDGGGNATATLVHRGRIIGVWQTSEDPLESVRYHFFNGVPKSVRNAAEEDLAAAGAMYFGRDIDVVEVASMKPLRAGGGRSASHPLDDRLHRASRRARAQQ
jgi:hypothetical protein